MSLFESHYIGKAFFDLFLYTISIQLDDHFCCTQKRSSVLEFVEEHFKFSDDVIDTIHLDDQL